MSQSTGPSGLAPNPHNDRPPSFLYQLRSTQLIPILHTDPLYIIVVLISIYVMTYTHSMIRLIYVGIMAGSGFDQEGIIYKSYHYIISNISFIYPLYQSTNSKIITYIANIHRLKPKPKSQ